MLKFYYGLGTCALAPHIALEDSGLDYTAEPVDMKANQQNSPDYLAINPKGRVPALATDRGILTETPAILAFIAQMAPKAGLAPLNDAFAFAEVQAFNSYLCSTLHVSHAHRVRGRRWVTEESSLEDMRRKVPENIRAGFDLIENRMFRGPWVMGETYTICDPYLFTLSGWAKGDGVDIADFPKVAEHRKRMKERASVQKVLALYQA